MILPLGKPEEGSDMRQSWFPNWPVTRVSLKTPTGIRFHRRPCRANPRESPASGLLAFELEAGRREAVEATPNQAVDEHHDQGHGQRCSKQHIEATSVGCADDGAAKSRRGYTLSSK